MNGGARYWNEETQRWENGDEGAAAPVTPPPPPRPDFAPLAPEAGGGAQSAEWWSTRPSAQDGTGGPPGGGSAWPPAEGPGGATWSTPELPDGGARPSADPTTPVPAVPPVSAVPAVPAVTRRYSRKAVWSVLGGVAAAGVATALVLTLVVGDDDADRRTDDHAASASPSPTAELSTEDAGSSADQTPSPSIPASELPAGYELYGDAEGFTIARPMGWVRDTADSQYGMDVVNYRSSDGERRLQVYQVAESSPDESFELYLSDQTQKPDGFEELSLQNLDDGEFTGSRLEYLADSFSGEPDVGTWHVYDERFVAADGKNYAIAAYGPDASGRDDELELLKVALTHFCPPYTTCGAEAGLD